MIDKPTIEKIAKLARLQLSDKEASEFQAQLSGVLEHFETISSISTEKVEPLVTPTDMVHILREDQVQKDFDAELALMNAPAKSGRQFLVPPVV